jgi:hypothetical protein
VWLHQPRRPSESAAAHQRERTKTLKTSTIRNISLLSTAILVVATAVAAADPTHAVSTRNSLPAPSNAIEIGFSGGYQQATGDIASGMDSVDDLTGPGGMGELSIGARVTPHLGLAAYGGIGGYSAGDKLDEGKNDIVTLTAGIKSDWHFLPHSEIDPWVSAGGGVRWLVIDEDNAKERTLFGLDLLRVQAGVDWRVTPTFSMGPVISATATKYLSENNEMTSGYETIEDRDVNFNFAAGLQGRFDIATK